jgi:hypothetical protein
MAYYLSTIPVAEEINYLAELAGVKCDNFKPIIVSSRHTPGAGEESLLEYTPSENSVWIVTGADINGLPAGYVGNIRWFVNDVAITPQVPAIGLLNAGIIFLFAGGAKINLALDGVLPATEVAIRVVGYSAPAQVATCLAPYVTQIFAADDGTIP